MTVCVLLLLLVLSMMILKVHGIASSASIGICRVSQNGEHYSVETND